MWVLLEQPSARMATNRTVGMIVTVAASARVVPPFSFVLVRGNRGRPVTGMELSQCVGDPGQG